MFHLRTTRNALLLLGLGGLVLSGPLAAIGRAQEFETTRTVEAPGYFAEPEGLAKGIDFAVRTIGGDTSREPKNGFYPETGEMITGAGWLSIGPGYRHSLLGDRALIDTSVGYSWRGYKAAQARFELPRLFKSRLTVGTQYRWQDLTQVSYFGEGSAAPSTDRTEYRLTSHNVVGYATVQTTPWLSVRGRVGWLDAPRLRDPAGHFERGNPSTLAVFVNDPVVLRGSQPNYLHGDLSLIADTREFRNHPVRGGLYRAGWAAYSDRVNGAFSFQRYELEGAQFIPLSADRIVFALRGWSAVTASGDNSIIPFYMQPSLGGASTLRAFENYRFHDRHMLVLNAETRIALFTHVDGALFVDAGNVAGRIRDLNLAHRSYGVGLRVHSTRATFGRLDVAHGSEGWRVLFRMNDPLRIARLSVRTATMPFVP